MIKAFFLKNKNLLIGFEIRNHGQDIVCSAVSILALNTVNSLEAFTDASFSLDYDVNGGFLKCIIERNSLCEKSNLLISSLELGLLGIEKEYPNEISVKYKEVR